MFLSKAVIHSLKPILHFLITLRKLVVTVHKGEGGRGGMRVGAGALAHRARIASVTKVRRWRCC
jgi:hypothetical protein